LLAAVGGAGAPCYVDGLGTEWSSDVEK